MPRLTPSALWGLVLLTLLATVEPLRAAPAANQGLTPEGPPAAAGEHRLVWNYPRFRLWQVGLSAVATGYFTYSVLKKPHDIDWTWRTPLPGDEFTREHWVAESHAGRERANDASNRLWHIVEFFPFADGVITPLLSDNLNLDVAFQLTLLNWQGIAVMGATNRLTHDWIRRDRPALEGCAEQGPEYSDYCESTSPAKSQSFISGHAASVFYGAGATCAHHLALPLYGHPAADVGICALALGAATADAVLRIVADAHWMTDVLAGALAGLGSGWGLAYGLHYATPLKKLREAGIMLLPVASHEKLELHLTGHL